jgi:DNA-binding NtrC family response regulator
MTTDKTILIVDDEKVVRDLEEQIFSKEGYKVRSAESAEQALDILKKENILVMFFDLQLPNMNGIDLCKEIREKSPVAVIYAITGYATIFDVFECRRAGFDDFFIKPFSNENILKAAQDAFEKIERWNVLPYA